MKPKDYLTTLTITLALSLSILAVNIAKTHTYTSAHKITLTGQIEPLKVEYDDRLVERVEELTREVQRLEWENADLKEQIKAYGGFWKE